MPLRVALDATPLSLTSGGLRRYVSELARALACGFPDDRFVLMSDQPFDLPENAPPNLTRAAGPRGRIERRWWSCGLPRRLAEERIGVFHGVNFEVPLVPLVPSVLTLHDLSPWRADTWHDGMRRVRARTPRLAGLGLATMVIAPTEAIRREAIERLRIAPSRIVAIPEAAAPSFQPVETPPRPPYFLYAGALEPRKNVGVIVDAWRMVRGRHDVDLVLAGRCREGFAAPTPEQGLLLAGEVTDGELARLYSGAQAFLYPSLYEGFGLPVLEAMQCGAPALISREPALAEVSGGAAVPLDTHDARAWAAAMSRVLEDPGWRAGLREHSLARAREFTWAETARRTREVYAEAICRFGL